MAGQASICNRALTKVGDDRIISIDDDTERARVLKALWDDLVDSEIRARNWNFAMKRASLAALVSTPDWGFDYEYQLPADCLRPVQISEYFLSDSLTDFRASTEVPFQIEGLKILTNLAAPLPIRYLRRVTNVGEWDKSFVDVFACKLAVDACERLSQNSSKKEMLLGEYRLAIAAAVRADAIENPPEHIPDTSWITARA